MTLTGELVLVVDDDVQARRLVERILAPHGFACSFASDAAEARGMLRSIAYPLVLCDIQMPGESGLEFIQSVSAIAPHAAVVMMSVEDDPLVASVAIDRGAYGYLVKPYTANELRISVENALHRRRLEHETRAYRDRLEEQVAARTVALRDAVDEIARSQAEIIRRLSRAVEIRDVETGGHIERIGELSARLATTLGLPADRVELLRLAAPMHDVGKIGIPDEILLKPGSFTPPERAQMERHAALGYAMLCDSGIELLDLAASIAHTHHERFDGTGYPRGLTAGQIPIEGRIVAVADVYDAVSNDRVYRAAMAPDAVMRLIREGSGSQFDPAVVDGLLACVPALSGTRDG